MHSQKVAFHKSAGTCGKRGSVNALLSFQNGGSSSELHCPGFSIGLFEILDSLIKNRGRSRYLLSKATRQVLFTFSLQIKTNVDLYWLLPSRQVLRSRSKQLSTTAREVDLATPRSTHSHPVSLMFCSRTRSVAQIISSSHKITTESKTI